MTPFVPRLLYHNLAPPLYPEGDSGENVLAIRFQTPVRVSSLRIVPEGVGSISGIGSTYPTVFSAKLLLNTSPTEPEPVNALTATEIEYDGREGWEQDYEIGMPEGVSTRLMLIVGKFDRLSVSVYGHESTSRSNGPEEDIREVISNVPTETVERKEDWSWISGWAGGVHGLLDILDDADSDTDHHAMQRRQRALECLDLQCDVDPTVLDLIVNHPTALSYLLLLPSYPPQPILQRLFREPKYALHPALRHHLPPKHTYRPLVEGRDEERRQAAWRSLPDTGAMIVLDELGVGDWDVEVANGQSRMGRLVEVLQDWQGDTEGYERGLDLLFKSLGEGEGDRPVRERYVARTIPGLIVKSRLLGSERTIGHSELCKRDLLAALAEVMSDSNDPSTRGIAVQLAQPFLPLAPYDRIFQSPGPKEPKPSAQLSEPSNDPIKRAEERFVTSLDHPQKPNGYVHCLTPSQILSSIAPNLLESLSTARNPPFGISSSTSSLKMGVGGSSTSATASASTFAGKVYSSHEFRTREISNNTTTLPGGGVGMGISMGMSMGSGSGSGAGAGAGAGLGIGAGAGAGAGGLGVNALKASRPASRHVDDYAR